MAGSDRRHGGKACNDHPRSVEQVFREAAASDLNLLARLHGRELSIRDVEDIRRGSFADLFALLPVSEEAEQAVTVIDQGWQVLPEDDARLVDELAADYAATYLTFRHRVPVTESVCLDEDNLERQQPMRDVRAWYRRFGVAAPDWRKMPDDHVALQLAFVAHLMTVSAQSETGQTGGEVVPVPLAEAATYLDAHLLRWIDDFALAAASRCATPFYAGLAMFTRAWLVAFREALCIFVPAEPAAEGKAENTDGSVAGHGRRQPA